MNASEGLGARRVNVYDFPSPTYIYIYKGIMFKKANQVGSYQVFWNRNGQDKIDTLFA